MKTFVRCNVVLFAWLIATVNADADVVRLTDGSIINGKVKSQTANSIMMKNRYGYFKIKRSIIKELIITDDYTQDVEILKKKGIDVDIKKIIEDRKAGDQKDESTLEEVQPDDSANNKRWRGDSPSPGGADQGHDENQGERPRGDRKEDSRAHTIVIDAENADDRPGETGTITISNKWRDAFLFVNTSYLSSVGKLHGKIPFGFIMAVGYDQAFNHMKPIKWKSLLPRLSIEAGFMTFYKGSNGLYGPCFNAGPKWSFDITKNGRWRFHCSLMPGISIIMIQSNNGKRLSTKLSVKAQTAIEHRFSEFSMYASPQYWFFYDKNIHLHGMGASLGFVFQIK